MWINVCHFAPLYSHQNWLLFLFFHSNVTYVFCICLLFFHLFHLVKGLNIYTNFLAECFAHMSTLKLYSWGPNNNNLLSSRLNSFFIFFFRVKTFYCSVFWNLATRLFHDPALRRFVRLILLKRLLYTISWDISPSQCAEFLRQIKMELIGYNEDT